jgi:hypothetical protein
MNASQIALFSVFCASAVNSLFYIFVKLAHNRCILTKEPVGMTWQYWVGIFCAGVAGIVNVVAIGYADMITMSSASAVTLLFNTLFARVMLHEKLTGYDMVSIGSIAVGTIICVFNANFEDVEYDSKALFNLFFIDLPNLIFIGTTITLMVLSRFWAHAMIVKTYFVMDRFIRDIKSFYGEFTEETGLVEGYKETVEVLNKIE